MTVRQQTIGEMGPDETGSADDDVPTHAHYPLLDGEDQSVYPRVLRPLNPDQLARILVGRACLASASDTRELIKCPESTTGRRAYRNAACLPQAAC